jgi:hypothetical protein
MHMEDYITAKERLNFDKINSKEHLDIQLKFYFDMLPIDLTKLDLSETPNDIFKFCPE